MVRICTDNVKFWREISITKSPDHNHRSDFCIRFSLSCTGVAWLPFGPRTTHNKDTGKIPSS